MPERHRLLVPGEFYVLFHMFVNGAFYEKIYVHKDLHSSLHIDGNAGTLFQLGALRRKTRQERRKIPRYGVRQAYAVKNGDRRTDIQLCDADMSLPEQSRRSAGHLQLLSAAEYVAQTFRNAFYGRFCHRSNILAWDRRHNIYGAFAAAHNCGNLYPYL